MKQNLTRNPTISNWATEGNFAGHLLCGSVLTDYYIFPSV